MRVRILVDHDFTPPGHPRLVVAYKAGAENTVKREWGAALVAAGRAVAVAPPRRAPR